MMCRRSSGVARMKDVGVRIFFDLFRMHDS